MKKFFAAAVLGFIVLAPISQAFAKPVEARIQDVFLGEMDPVVLGDICVVSVETSDGQKLGLLPDYHFCAEMDMEASVGAEITFDSTDLESIRDGKAISILKKYKADYTYLEIYTFDIKGQ